MKPDSLLGVWTGTAHNSNGWDMKITLSVLQPFAIGTMLGIFDIPLMPCSGTFRLVAIRGEALELEAQLAVDNRRRDLLDRVSCTVLDAGDAAAGNGNATQRENHRRNIGIVQRALERNHEG